MDVRAADLDTIWLELKDWISGYFYDDRSGG